MQIDTVSKAQTQKMTLFKGTTKKLWHQRVNFMLFFLTLEVKHQVWNLFFIPEAGHWKFSWYNLGTLSKEQTGHRLPTGEI